MPAKRLPFPILTQLAENKKRAARLKEIERIFDLWRRNQFQFDQPSDPSMSPEEGFYNIINNTLSGARDKFLKIPARPRTKPQLTTNRATVAWALGYKARKKK